MQLKIDFHIHSDHSGDGLMSVGTIFECARRRGLAGVAVCDHNSLDGAQEALDRAPRDLLVVPGAEYSTDRGHMLTYFITRSAQKAGLRRTRNGLYDFGELFDFVKSEGGLLFAAHPFRRPPARLDGVYGMLDGVEVFNARNTRKDIEANARARALLDGGGLSFVAGSDAHTPHEVGNACRIFERAQMPDLSALKAMMLEKNGQYYGRLSPYTVQGVSSFVRHLRDGSARKTAKSLLKIGYGGFYDAAFRLNGHNEPLVRGRTYDVNNEPAR